MMATLITKPFNRSGWVSMKKNMMVSGPWLTEGGASRHFSVSGPIKSLRSVDGGNVTGKRGLSNREREFGGAVSVGGINVTHPKKVWWPEEKITKLDVAHYYLGVASHIVPWLKKQSLTAERCPDGIEGECFFQKNFSEDLPSGVSTRAIPGESTGEVVH